MSVQGRVQISVQNTGTDAARPPLVGADRRGSNSGAPR
jgi:hypothetical protein